MGSTTSKGTTRRRGRARELQPETAEKQRRCMELAIKGLTYQEIAEAEGYSDHSSARWAVARGFERAFDTAADQLRPIYQGRAELLWMKGMTLLQEGLDGSEDEEGEPTGPDLDKVRVGAQIADRALGRLMRLSGLDQAAVTVSVGGSDLERLKNEFAGLLASPTLDAEVVEVDDRG
ncbi:hypothetical protein [Nocardia fluminea]|uniref:hypothetical protein n=1 Tax=Nocardia fluminea TaxID=134984 RepID=UPI003657DDD8